MPPNRKANVDAVQGYADLGLITVETKFAPLTVPTTSSSENQSQDKASHPEPNDNDFIRAAHTKDSSHPANSYWDWPAASDSEATEKQRLIQQILEEEKARMLISAEHQELNLISSKTAPKVEIVQSESTPDENYWLQPNKNAESSSKSTASPKLSYWDWPTRTREEEKQALIASILEDEECRKLLSIEHVESKLKEAAAKKLSNNASASNATHPKNDEYWSWNVQDAASKNSQDYWEWPTRSSKEEKLNTIQQILKEEEIRQQLSAEHIQSNLVQAASSISAAQPNSAVSTGPDASYWDW